VIVVPQQILSKSRKNRGVLIGHSKDHPLGYQIPEYR
jgi:hypothetical protein